MKSKITVKSRLTWFGGIEFLDDCMFPSEWNHLLKDSDMPDYVQPILMPNLSIERLRYRYIKQIEEEILDGNLDGTLQIGRSELNWVWKPEFFIDDEEVSFHNIKDQIDID